MSRQIWVLLEEYNEYDQQGKYFVAAFSREPTEDDLKVFDRTHFGRSNNEYSWVTKERVPLFN